jgi:hypothetical protein
LHPSPAGQRAQFGGPPQSGPVSLAFRTPSEHVGGWQDPCTHTPEIQSAPTLQGLPMKHALQKPPQLNPVSPLA